MKLFEFKKIYFAHSLLIVAFSLLSALGFWQLSRAAAKRDILNHFRIMQKNSAHRLEEMTHYKNFQKVTVTGRYDNQHQFLLDNQYHDHQIGYQVLTPLILDNGKLLLVNRGWVKANPNRTILPTLAAIANQQTVYGTLYFDHNNFILGNSIDGVLHWPLRIEKIDVMALTRILGKSLYPFTLRLNQAQPYGFVRDWKLVIMMPSRHIAYAVQWFLMAFIVLIIFFRLNFERKND